MKTEGKNKPLLSICIPTYNRKWESIELIQRCLEVNNSNIEIVVTDQMSTDGTVEAIKELRDSRIRVIINQEPMIGYLNMIQSIYNAAGKYALYVNDRDLLYTDKIVGLIELLEKKDYAFVSTLEATRHTNGNLVEYEDTYASLMGHSALHHPTGMIYNRDLIDKYIPKEDIFSYESEKEVYYWDFLMRELFKYGKTAIWNNGLWSQRSYLYLQKNQSGVAPNNKRVYFLPQNKIYFYKKIFYQLFERSCFDFDNIQKFNIAKLYIDRLTDCGGAFKWCIGDSAETAHYGLKKRFIGLHERLRIDKITCEKMAAFLQRRGYPNEWIAYQKSNFRRKLIIIILKDLKMDLSMIKRRISRLFILQ